MEKKRDIVPALMQLTFYWGETETKKSNISMNHKAYKEKPFGLEGERGGRGHFGGGGEGRRPF